VYASISGHGHVSQCVDAGAAGHILCTANGAPGLPGLVCQAALTPWCGTAARRVGATVSGSQDPAGCPWGQAVAGASTSPLLADGHRRHCAHVPGWNTVWPISVIARLMYTALQ
jgi:hypothetical protein